MINEIQYLKAQYAFLWLVEKFVSLCYASFSFLNLSILT